MYIKFNFGADIQHDWYHVRRNIILIVFCLFRFRFCLVFICARCTHGSVGCLLGSRLLFVFLGMKGLCFVWFGFSSVVALFCTIQLLQYYSMMWCSLSCTIDIIDNIYFWSDVGYRPLFSLLLFFISCSGVRSKAVTSASFSQTGSGTRNDELF